MAEFDELAKIQTSKCDSSPAEDEPNVPLNRTVSLSWAMKTRWEGRPSYQNASPHNEMDKTQRVHVSLSTSFVTVAFGHEERDVGKVALPCHNYPNDLRE